MKIVNEKGKLFGLINVVDLIILIAIVLVGGAIIWQLIGNQVNDAVSQKVELNAEVVIAEVPIDLVDEVYRQDLVGEQVVSGNQYLEATVSDIWIEDHKFYIETAAGDLAENTNPSFKDIHIVITTQVAPDASGYEVGAQELRVGKEYIVKTQTFEYLSKVYKIDVDDSE